MRFIADSNILGPTIDLLGTIFAEHEFATTVSNSVEDMDDIPLFAYAAQHGYNAIITKLKTDSSGGTWTNALR